MREGIERVTCQLGIEAARREGYARSLRHARETLPAPWAARVENLTEDQVRDWQHELRTLRERDIEAKADALRETRASLNLRRHRLTELEGQEAEFPAEARDDPAAIRDRLIEARRERSRQMEELIAAHRGKDQLRETLSERQELERRCLEADKALRMASTLVRLLGRDHLQRHLVRQAERRIVDISNGILDRLSGGQLRLDLRPESIGASRDDEVLDLVAYSKAAGAAPIGVAFLSGSQRFRVAVSLALGIGQYASRQHRPIESVIIDEGFGCLDRQGRQVMIQELQNLRSQLRLHPARLAPGGIRRVIPEWLPT